MGGQYVGAIVRRREDPRLLTGAGAFVDDLKAAGAAHVAIVRSTRAHAGLVRIGLDAARRRPGVAGAWAFADLADVLRPLPVSGIAPAPLQARVGFQVKTAVQYPLARGKVRYVGEPVAVVAAADPYAAHDAAEAVAVEYEPRPAVVD